jgi:hypothetical protein
MNDFDGKCFFGLKTGKLRKRGKNGCEIEMFDFLRY